VADEAKIKLEITQYALDELGVNHLGFDEEDIRLLELLVGAKGKPMGLSTIGAALSEDEGTIEDVLEPYLLANGYIERTARGRIATQKSYEHFRLKGPARQSTKEGLFE
jgi:Holliday junction DNA helicase RuvB